MARPLVIGYGNPLCGDDGFGWAVAHALRKRACPADIITPHQLTPELAEAVSQAERVIFVDIEVGEPVGQLRQCSLDATNANYTPTHHMTPDQLLAWTRLLYDDACPDAYLLTVTGADFGLGMGLSPSVKARVCAAVDGVMALLMSAQEVP